MELRDLGERQFAKEQRRAIRDAVRTLQNEFLEPARQPVPPVLVQRVPALVEDSHFSTETRPRGFGGLRGLRRTYAATGPYTPCTMPQTVIASAARRGYPAARESRREQKWAYATCLSSTTDRCLRPSRKASWSLNLASGFPRIGHSPNDLDSRKCNYAGSSMAKASMICRWIGVVSVKTCP